MIDRALLSKYRQFVDIRNNSALTSLSACGCHVATQFPSAWKSERCSQLLTVSQECIPAEQLM